MSASNVYVGMDVHKATISIAAAEEGRDGEVRFIGTVPNRPSTVIAMLGKLRGKHGRLECIYEAGPCAYTLYRELVTAGFQCIVAAPSKIPTTQGRVKNDHRDAVGLARLLRADDATAVWVPEPVHEAMRDLVRARHAASFDVRKARQRIQSYLLLRDRHYPSKMWGGRHRIWLTQQLLEHPAVSAEVILTHCTEVKVTHLGEDGSHFGAADVDPGASSGDPSHGPKGRERQGDREAAGVLAQYGAQVFARRGGEALRPA